MNFQNTLNNIEFAADIAQTVGTLTLVWQKQSAGFDIFNFQNKDAKPVSIQDDANYLKLFLQVAEQIFREKKDKSTTFLCICSSGGEKLFLKPYEEAEKEEYKYSYIAISNALKKLPDEDRPAQLNFFSEISYEHANNPDFEKESQKVAKLLKGENRNDWLAILENKYDFLKTDMFMYDLPRLYSWGFQAVKPGDELDSKISLILPVKPQARGAIRKKRNKRN